VWIGFIWLRIRRRAGFCEHVNEHYGSIKFLEFLKQMNSYVLLKKHSAPWGQLVNLNAVDTRKIF
jgi:hypothetical protein